MLVNVNKMPPKRRHLSIYRVKLYFHPTPSGGWRVFTTIDAAANTANQIGFRRIEVDLSSRR